MSLGLSAFFGDKEMRVKDRVALVTGGASGIGRATAVLLAQEGGKVVIVDVNASEGSKAEEEIVTSGGQAIFLEADVSVVANTERIVQEAVARYGRLDILVNNAGIMLEKSAVDTTEADWDRIVGVNLKGIFFCAKNAILQFRRQGSGGNIVNMASVNSFYAEGGIAAYAMTKGGIAQLTRALAIDHSAEGIRVNAICPGWIETPMNAAFFQSGPDIREKAQKLAAIGRIGTPQDIAQGVLYLVSEAASFVTGSLVTIDGGFSAGLAIPLGIVI
jgi:NAD(P)-dependent dehydrogenase (short-subunit alcohol dehydrogenase family)